MPRKQTELATRRSHPFDETYYTLSIMRARPAERAEECTNRSSARGGVAAIIVLC